MILVLGGSRDGQKLVRCLAKKGQKVKVIPYSGYEVELAPEDGARGIEENIAGDFASWLKREQVQAVVDARHPSLNSGAVDGENYAEGCREAGVPFYRIGREETKTEDSDHIYKVFSMEQAAGVAVTLGKNIFLTTGSNQLEPFLRRREEFKRLVVRVLPEHRVIKKCQDMGIKPRDIVAMQGPFSRQVNQALFKMYRSSVIVTKDSGKAGGTDTKLAAARALKIPVVMVKKDVSGAALKWQEVLSLLTNPHKSLKE